MTFYIILFTAIFLGVLYSFIYLLNIKINKLEYRIKHSFAERTGLIPAIYDLTKEILTKHDEIFKDILNYRKIEFVKVNSEENFLRMLELESKIHNELNFIFKVCNKHPRLMKKGNFIYLRDLIMEKSYNIGKLMEIYRHILKRYNKLIFYKNLTIIGLFIPLQKRELKFI